MAKKGKVTFEEKLEKCKQKIKEQPNKANNKIGSLIVSEVRKVTPKLTGKMRKSLSYWARKKEGDLQVGFKIWYAVPVILGSLGTKANNFFLEKVKEKIPAIKAMYDEVMKELEKED